MNTDQANQVTELFLTNDPIPVKLRYSNKVLRKETNDSTYIDSEIEYMTSDDSWNTLEVKIRARGNYRRENCYFPPVKMKIKKSVTAGTLFEGNKKLKLVLPCVLQNDYNLPSTILLDPKIESHIQVDKNAVFEKAKNHGICPAETLFDIASMADILIGDYNYIFDPRVQMRHLFQSDDQSDWILIIDEAHNLYDRTIDSLSPAVSKFEVEELKKSIINKKMDEVNINTPKTK